MPRHQIERNVLYALYLKKLNKKQKWLKCTSMNPCCIKNKLQDKVARLFKNEDGCVKEGERGSIVIGRDLNVWFGWNHHYNMKCEGIMEAREIVTELLNQGYVFYHDEDLVAYLNPDPFNCYTECRKRRGDLYNITSDKEELRMLLGWTEDNWCYETLRARTVIV